MKKNRALRLTFSLATGAVFVLLAGRGRLGALVSGLGLSLIVAGITSAFREIAILRLESEETGDDIAARVSGKLREALPLQATSMNLVSPIRRGYAGYYSWAIRTEPEELFFAGRSVLHRIDADFRARGLSAAEQVLLKKLKAGSVVRILLLDPRSDLIGRLAKEEDQPLEQMLSDIANSLGICQRLNVLLEQSELPPAAQLSVRVYDEVPYFSYHRAADQVIVGFYFVTALGSASAAFEIADPQTRGFFESHFTSIFGRASGILEMGRRGAPHFDTKLFSQLRECLIGELGLERCDRQLAGS